MVLLFYIALNILVIFLFFKVKKNLDILEIIVYWMVASYVFQNFSALCYMNLKTLIVPEQLSYELAHFLNRIVLFPVVMVAFLNFFQALYQNYKRLLLLLCFIFILAGLELLAHYSGVLIHVNWRVWWSFSYWLSALLILIGFMKLFRKFLYKGGF